MSDSRARQPLNEVEQQTFHELYQTHRQRVYSICIRMTADAAEAEVLTQDVFLHLFRTIGSFRGESAFTTWLHRLTVNLVLMHFRRRKRRRESISDTGELPFYAEGDTLNPMGMRVVDGILLSEVMAKLPNGYRQALVLHDMEGFEHNEIAAMRGRSVGTSKSQLHKARILLRQIITQTKPTKHFQYD